MESKRSKTDWRDWAREIDHSPYSGDVVTHIAGWAPLRGVVASYLPMPSEIDLGPLAGEASLRIVIPRVERDRTMTMRVYDETELESHVFGFEQPTQDAELVHDGDIDIVLLPGLAFDAAGGRLGRGGGYYDRLLGRVPETTTRIGVTTSAAVIDGVPMDPHDERVDWIATESGITRVGEPLPDATLEVLDSAVAAGLAPRMHRFPDGTRTSVDAARAVGCELGAIAKSLVFEVDGDPVLVLCSGDHRVDEAKLAALRGGSRSKPAARDRVFELTGFPAGGTPAVGHRVPIDVVADVSLARYRYVWSAGGTVDTVYPVALERLVAASDARWADVSTRG